MAKKYQVVIVGGGPVGVALAVELGMRGVSVFLAERHKTMQRIPKGQNLGQRTLELFHFWKIEKQLRAARVMPNDYPIGGVIAWGDLTSKYFVAPPGREVIRRYFAQDNDRLPQYQTEGVLRARMAQLPSVEARFGWTAEKVEQDANGVRITFAERDGTGRETVEADYAVGCDGAHSAVREQMGIQRGGRDHDQLMLLAVFRSKELHEGLKRYPERTTYRAMRPEGKGYWYFFGRVDVGEGWFFHAPVPPDTTKDNYDFHALIQKAAGFKFKAEFDYVGFWDMKIAVADTYQVGRVLIAGDAAHSHPPYGGYGLNSGLEDVKNLGWKLSAVLQGWGGAALLKSYSDERKLIFQEIGELFIGKRIEFERDFMDRYSPEKNLAEFEQAWSGLMEHGEERVRNYEPSYEGSTVVWRPPDAISTAKGKHMIKARAGHHLSPRPLSSGKELYDELGFDFNLIALDADDATVAAFQKAAAARNIPLKVIRDSYAGGREEWETKLILVRPDQYIGWIGERLTEDAGAIMTKVVGKDHG